jgi:hypothetical protein
MSAADIDTAGLVARLRARKESVYDYAVQSAEWHDDALCQEAAAALEAAEAQLATERDARLAAEARVAVLEKALDYARPLVERWCHTQGNARAFFDETLGPIDRARAALQSTPTSETSNG